MALIKSISGIRGTIGGLQGDNLTPIDIVKFTCAFAQFLKIRYEKTNARGARRAVRVVVGRDGRMSGDMVNRLVTGSLLGMGVNVVDLGLSTTPTVEMAVTHHRAQGGIILTASHNPAEWNALKLLGRSGEFLDAAEGQEVLALAEKMDFSAAPVRQLGKLTYDTQAIAYHIAKVLRLRDVDPYTIKKARLRVVVDGINSTGGDVISRLLKTLGVQSVKVINGIPNGNFAHNPEPLPAHLTELSEKVRNYKADLGISVDPDVDRLAFVCEDGSMFGEEYTLVSVARYVLGNRRGPNNTVSNMSSTRALRDITEDIGGQYFSAPVGEVNVVARMKQVKAVIGGEGNGGVIYPALHYGRDALVGVALFLSAFAKQRLKDETFSMTRFRDSLPSYVISKNRIDLSPGMKPDAILAKIRKKYASEKISTEDGIRIDFEKTREWVQLRKSNTEPIMRVYAESTTARKAEALGKKFVNEIKQSK